MATIAVERDRSRFPPSSRESSRAFSGSISGEWPGESAFAAGCEPPGSPGAPLSPADLEQRYNFPPGDGTGQTIAIAEFGGGYFAADVAAFCQKFKRQSPSIQAVSVDAPAFTLQQIMALPPAARKEALGDSIEVMMDIEIIAGLCGGANISVYFSTFDRAAAGSIF